MNNGWGIPPFIRIDYENKTQAKSSRMPGEGSSKVNDFVCDTDLTQFSMTTPLADVYKWVVFTNSGSSDLVPEAITVKGPFKLYGEMPEILKPQCDVRIRVAFEPDEGGDYAGELVFDFEGDLRYSFLCHGVWEPQEIYYDGSIRYSGEYMHSSFNSLTNDIPLGD